MARRKKSTVTKADFFQVEYEESTPSDPHGRLVSRVNHPITVELTDGVNAVLPPKGTLDNLYRSQLPDRLPRGTAFVKSNQER